jgi:hypothetical protein
MISYRIGKSFCSDLKWFQNDLKILLRSIQDDLKTLGSGFIIILKWSQNDFTIIWTSMNEILFLPWFVRVVRLKAFPCLSLSSLFPSPFTAGWNEMDKWINGYQRNRWMNTMNEYNEWMQWMNEWMNECNKWMPWMNAMNECNKWMQ